MNICFNIEVRVHLVYLSCNNNPCIIERPVAELEIANSFIIISKCWDFCYSFFHQLHLLWHILEDVWHQKVVSYNIWLKTSQQ